MKNCPKCGGEIKENAKFCRHCGEKIEQKPEFIFCDECGAKLEAGSTFCDECGAKLDGAPADDPWGAFEKPKNDDPWANFADYKEPETIVVEKIVEVEKPVVVEKPVEVVVEKVVEKVVQQKPSQPVVSDSMERDYQEGLKIINDTRMTSVKKRKQAINLMLPKAHAGDKDACIAVAKTCMKIEDYVLFKDILKSLVEEDNAEALGCMGEYYRLVEKDIARAERTLLLSGKKGYAEAYFQLAKIYEGNDDKQAFAYFKQGAEAGSGKCARFVMSAYRWGTGTYIDKKQHDYWLQRAAELGDGLSQWWLGAYYFKGVGGFPKDTEKAKYWLKKAANNPVYPVSSAKKVLKGDLSDLRLVGGWED